VLTESGLLNDHDAMTTRSLAPLFRTRDPSVRDESHVLINSGSVVTPGRR
jgi:hypothetical protein